MDAHSRELWERLPDFTPMRIRTQLWDVAGSSCPSQTEEFPFRLIFGFFSERFGCRNAIDATSIQPVVSAVRLRPPLTKGYLRLQPLQAGSPPASRSISTSSPFFTSAAMMAGLPSNVIREPFTSILSFGAIFTS